MPRIRTIKPSFWKHEELSELPEATHMLAAALLNYADDHGYFNANPKLVRAECCPLREPSVSVPESLRSLQTIGYIRLGTGADGKRYGQIIKFDEHQKVSHATESKIALISIEWGSSREPTEDSGNSPEPLRPELKGIEGNRIEEEGEGKSRALRASRLPPDWELSEDLRGAASDKRRNHNLPSIDLDLEAEKFRNHWRSQPGSKGLKLDWRATWLNWILRAEPPKTSNGVHGASSADLKAEIKQALERKGYVTG